MGHSWCKVPLQECYLHCHNGWLRNIFLCLFSHSEMDVRLLLLTSGQATHLTITLRKPYVLSFPSVNFLLLNYLIFLVCSGTSANLLMFWGSFFCLSFVGINMDVKAQKLNLSMAIVQYCLLYLNRLTTKVPTIKTTASFFRRNGEQDYWSSVLLLLSAHQ